MITKILKLELFTLFFLTIICSTIFYFHGSLPDNIYEISSNSQSINTFSYYLTSLGVFFNYYIGPWIIFPFVMFSFFYAFLYIQRNYLFDIFNIVPLLSLFLLTTYAVYPVLLGGGIQLVLKDYLSALSITFGVIGSLLVFLGGSFRSGFQEFIFRFGKFLISIPKYFFRASENIKISKAKKEMYLPKKKNNFSILNTLKMLI